MKNIKRNIKKINANKLNYKHGDISEKTEKGHEMLFDIEFIKIPILNVTQLVDTFNAMKEKIKKHKKAHPKDKNKYAVSIVQWNSDYFMTPKDNYNKENEYLAIWITEKSVIDIYPKSPYPTEVKAIQKGV